MSPVKHREEVPEIAVEAAESVCRSRSMEFEVYAFGRQLTKAHLDSSHTRWVSYKDMKGLFLRVVTGGRVGVGYANDFSRPAIKKCLDSAIKLARLREKEDNWQGFPSSSRPYPSVRGLRDASLVAADMTALVDLTVSMAEAAESEGPEVAIGWTDVEREESSISVANSNGLRVSSKSALVRAACSALNGRGDSVSPECIDGRASRRLDVDGGVIGSTVGRLAASCARAQKPKTHECEVVFARGALGYPDSGLLSVVLKEALSGGNLVRGSTFLAGRVGQKIASKHVTIVDNPKAPNRTGSRPFDDEGVPTRKQTLVEGGVLKGFVWDHRYSKAAGRKSTGNAIRNMASGSVFPRPLNLEFGAGRGDMEKLVSEVDDGYLIWGCQGGHTSDTETGDFSFVSSPCFRIRQGSIIGGVRGAMVSGNVLDLMKNVTVVGSDVADLGGAMVPSMLIRAVKITSS